MTTIKINDLYILVSFTQKDVYPRIFLTRESAEATNTAIGGYYEVKNAFINS